MSTNRHDCGAKYDLLRAVSIANSLLIQLLILTNFEYKFIASDGEQDYRSYVGPLARQALTILGYS